MEGTERRRSAGKRSDAMLIQSARKCQEMETMVQPAIFRFMYLAAKTMQLMASSGARQVYVCNVTTSITSHLQHPGTVPSSTYK